MDTQIELGYILPNGSITASPEIAEEPDFYNAYFPQEDIEPDVGLPISIEQRRIMVIALAPFGVSEVLFHVNLIVAMDSSQYNKRNKMHREWIERGYCHWVWGDAFDYFVTGLLNRRGSGMWARFVERFDEHLLSYIEYHVNRSFFYHGII